MRLTIVTTAAGALAVAAFAAGYASSRPTESQPAPGGVERISFRAPSVSLPGSSVKRLPPLGVTPTPTPTPTPTATAAPSPVSTQPVAPVAPSQSPSSVPSTTPSQPSQPSQPSHPSNGGDGTVIEG